MTSVTGEVRCSNSGVTSVGERPRCLWKHTSQFTLDVNCRASKGIIYDWVYLLVPLALDPKIVFENWLVCMNCGHPTVQTPRMISVITAPGVPDLTVYPPSCRYSKTNQWEVFPLKKSNLPRWGGIKQKPSHIQMPKFARFAKIVVQIWDT